jgi:hypothetical protein
MKKMITRGLTLISGLLWSFAYTGQSATGVVTETFQVSGNCGMCKKTIETAAAVKGVKTAHWNESSKVLTLKYDRSKTSASDVLRKVAYAGYDNEKYLAPDKAYQSLHGCCQYDRQLPKKENVANTHASHQSAEQKPVKEVIQPKETGVNKLYDAYFSMKDALVKSDAVAANSIATQMLTAIDGINMSAMSEKEHNVYMKLEKELKENAKNIAANRSLEKQRKSFSSLSEVMFELMKAVKPPYEVYLDNCPMYNDGKGANWLSKEKPIRNPYYGSKMMTCGNVKETLK